MRKGMNIAATIGVVFVTVIMLLPVLVKAETQSEVTEVADFRPSEENSDEVVNIANETIAYNIDSWDPLPAGIFVGGTVEESKMRLHEVASGGDGQASFMTVMKFQREYVMSGASTCYVRLPIAVDNDSRPLQVNLFVYMMTTPSYSAENNLGYVTPTPLSRYDMNPYHPDGLVHNNTIEALPASGDALISVWNVAHLNPRPRTHSPPLPDLPLLTDPSQNSYFTGGRLYVKLTAPLMPDYYYLFVTQVYYSSGQPFDFFFSAADLCSDNLTDSRVVYMFFPEVDTCRYRDNPVPADLGYSFVFQTGLGGHAYEYNSYYIATDILEWDSYVKVGTSYAAGALNFILEYRTNTTTPLNWSLAVWDDYLGVFGGGGLNDVWWHEKQSTSGYILASNPISRNYTADLIDGAYYVRLHCVLIVNQPIRVEFMTVYDPNWPAATNALTHSYYDAVGGHYYFRESMAFGMWCSLSIQNVSLNETDAIVLTSGHSGFWGGLGNWFDKHWIDIIAVELIVIGIALSCTGVGAVVGIPLVVLGLGMILYNNWRALREAINKLVKTIIDGLTWLGNWLWKIGQAIWKALTWFVDQLIYYGAILIGLLIIAVAIALFIGPLYALIKIMGAFLMMAKGDYEKAAAQLSGLAQQGRSAASTLTGGRIG
jgi:hypothetical protein